MGSDTIVLMSKFGEFKILCDANINANDDNISIVTDGYDGAFFIRKKIDGNIVEEWKILFPLNDIMLNSF